MLNAAILFLALAPPVEEVSNLTVLLIPLGKAPLKEVAVVKRALEKTYRVTVSIGPREPLPKETYYPPNHRYRAEHLIAWLGKKPGADKIFGVAHVDISTTTRGRKDWGLVGQAQMAGRGGIVSDFRLKGDRIALADVTMHEFGHLLGRPHCPTKGCLMHDKAGHIAIGHVHSVFCKICQRQLAPWLR